MKIGIVDLEICNVQSIINTVNSLDHEYQLVKSSKDLVKIDGVIFPGVGAFDETIKRLHHTGLYSTIQNELRSNSLPYFGICIGMQILFEGSEEGKLAGLNVFPGMCKKLQKSHIGWYHLCWTNNYLLHNIDFHEKFYFIHNYYVKLTDEYTEYSTLRMPNDIVSSISNGTVHGVQFHPEKSFNAGAKVITNYVEQLKCL